MFMKLFTRPYSVNEQCDCVLHGLVDGRYKMTQSPADDTLLEPTLLVEQMNTCNQEACLLNLLN